MNHRVDAEYVANLGYSDRVKAVTNLYRLIERLHVEKDALHAELNPSVAVGEQV